MFVSPMDCSSICKPWTLTVFFCPFQRFVWEARREKHQPGPFSACSNGLRSAPFDLVNGGRQPGRQRSSACQGSQREMVQCLRHLLAGDGVCHQLQGQCHLYWQQRWPLDELFLLYYHSVHCFLFLELSKKCLKGKPWVGLGKALCSSLKA